MTSCTGGVRGGFFFFFWRGVKKVSELSSASGEDGWLSLARRGFVSGAHVVWGKWKSQMYLSPYVEKPLSSKVIKSFVSELRSRKCFSCFGIPMFYVYMLWTFYVRFTYPYIWLCYMTTRFDRANSNLKYCIELPASLTFTYITDYFIREFANDIFLIIKFQDKFASLYLTHFSFDLFILTACQLI